MDRIPTAFDTGRSGDAGSILLGKGVHADLGLPDDLPAQPTPNHPVLELARGAGWRVSDLAPWMTFWAPDRRPTVHIGVLPWLHSRTFPLLDPTSLVTTTARCARFHELAGAPFHGITPGLAGIAALRVLGWNPRHRHAEPFWRPEWDNVEPVGNTFERGTEWTSGEAGTDWELGWDVNRQYLAAAGVAELAISRLIHRPVQRGKEHYTAVRRNDQGYYKTVIGEWPWSDRIPHPAGPHRRPGDVVWVTASTLDLLAQISAAHPDLLAHPPVYDRWTAPTSARIMRRWSQKLDSGIDVAESDGDTVLRTALKDCYKHALGMLERPTARVYRPDWSDTIIGLARANLWRKIWAQGAPFPTAVSADQVWYASPNDDHFAEWPEHFPSVVGAGGFHIYGAHHTRNPRRCWTETGVQCGRCRQLRRAA